VATAFRTERGITIAAVSGVLDDANGRQFASEVIHEVPKGGPLVVDGSELKILTHQGVRHLLAAQHWTRTPERKRLLLAAFSPTVLRAVTEDGSDVYFEAKATLAEALQSLLLVGGSAASYPAAPPASPAVAREPDSLSGRTEPAAANPQPRTAAGQSVFYTPPVGPKKSSPGKLLIWIAIATLLLLGGGAVWWLLGHRAPVLTLSAPSTVVEEDGKEVDEITAHVEHGQLAEKSWTALPKGLYFDPPAEDTGIYTLRGKAEAGATSTTLELYAIGNGGQQSKPAAFAVVVKPKPMAWQLNTLQSLGLKVGRQIWTQSKFVANAVNASATTGLPPGLTVERVPGRDKDWQLAGEPTTAGSFDVTFIATAPTGAQEKKSGVLEVAPDAAAAAAVAPTPAPAAVSTANVTPAVRVMRAIPVVADAPKAPNVDDGMRSFLLTRIENLPSRYTDEDRENLRLVVNGLQRARLIQRIVFEHDGQTALSAEESAKLKTALGVADNANLLKNPDCQILIVGYASKNGSLASNVRLSKERARAVDDLVKSVIGHHADLCGDYGPTDVVDQSAAQTNRAVEVYAGVLTLPPFLEGKAESFKQDFNRRHGVR
jgi:outer membrane protein OmpA-like peptidoglycan-associated protein